MLSLKARPANHVCARASAPPPRDTTTPRPGSGGVAAGGGGRGPSGAENPVPPSRLPHLSGKSSNYNDKINKIY